MAYRNLKDQSIEDVLNQVQGLMTVADQSAIQSVGALAARLTIEMAGMLQNVFDGLHNGKKTLSEVRRTLSDASIEASSHTAALVRWTKVLAWLTGAYALLTGGLLVATILKP